MRFKNAVRDMQFGRQNKFILTGEEEYLKDEFVRLARLKYPNHEVFSFYPGDEKEAVGLLSSSSLFEDRIVVLRYYDEMKIKNYEGLVKGFDDLLILVATETAKMKSALMTRTIGLCCQVQCSRMVEYGSEYSTWLVSKANEDGYTFSDGAEDILYQKIGPEMYTLSNELEKLKIFKETTRVITPDDVEKVVSVSAYCSVYNILDSFLYKDAVKTMKNVEAYLVHNDLQSLVGFMSHYVEKLYRMLLMRDEKIMVETMSDILRIPRFLIKTRYLPRAQAFGKNKLVSVLERLNEVEIGIRLFSGDKKILLDKFFYNFF